MVEVILIALNIGAAMLALLDIQDRWSNLLLSVCSPPISILFLLSVISAEAARLFTVLLWPLS
jgi:hypothetical protein